MVVRGAARRHEQVPDARRLRLGLQLLDDRAHLPAIAGLILFLIGRDRRAHLALDDVAHAALPVLLPLGEVEIHRCILSLYVHVTHRTDSGPLPSPATQNIRTRLAS